VRQLFLDTSALVAVWHKRDGHHERAARFLDECLRDGTVFVTTDYVFDEVVTFLRRRGGHALAVRVGEALRASRQVRVLEVQAPVRDRAWEVFVRHEDQELSFTDCVSFAVMRALDLREVFSFDRDFAAMGFLLLPTPRDPGPYAR
jgi:predicted nucleic acid-binding protein